MSLVLDASVALLWLAPGTNPAGVGYAQDILCCIRDGEVVLSPSLFALEVANVISRLEARGTIQEADSMRFLALLERLGIRFKETSSAAAYGPILHLARRHGLSAYDAAYLHLALTQDAWLATLDANLQRAARESGAKTHTS